MYSGLDRMKKRLQRAGGDIDGRINEGKYRSFLSAVGNSYQAEVITFNEKKYRCLINAFKLTEDYDRKEISIDHEAGMEEGSIFFWDRTNKHWIVSLQQFSEEAYFRGRIERCDQQIEINDHLYWITLRGPVETDIVWNQKHNINFNDLNYSLLIKITKNEETDEFFQRFKILKFDNHNWQVAAVDRYSTAGVLEVYLNEYYDNEDEEHMIVPEIITPTEEEPFINGPQIVKVFDKNLTYSVQNITDGQFVISSNKVKIINADSESCVLDIISSKSGEFNIVYKKEGSPDLTLKVTIDSF